MLFVFMNDEQSKQQTGSCHFNKSLTLESVMHRCWRQPWNSQGVTLKREKIQLEIWDMENFIKDNSASLCIHYWHCWWRTKEWHNIIRKKNLQIPSLLTTNVLYPASTWTCKIAIHFCNQLSAIQPSGRRDCFWLMNKARHWVLFSKQQTESNAQPF